ncbi:MAG TPA: GTP-binding protein [Lacunisphaera sp.]|jgi:G3E family GTPase|nr:GTP-binding protein [Lacunisphaera sp.]
MPSAPIPVTVLTGFLGAGKTTLLNRILTGQHGRKIAVIENEFGEVGVDNQLVIQSDEEIFEMNNGCICCTVRGDLLRILGRLMKRKDRLDAILIETTGLANPAPVAQTFFTDPEMREQFRLDAIVTLVDAKHILLHLDDSPEALKQIAFADVIVLNKTDLVSLPELAALEKRLHAVNAVARVYRAQNADVPIKNIIDVGGFNLGRAIEVDPQFLEMEYPFEWAGGYELAAGEHLLEIGHDPADPEHGHHHEHDHDCGPDCGHDHNELDVVVLPVKSFDEPVLTTAINATVQTYSDWEKITLPGETITPGATLHRLKLKDEYGKFKVSVAAAGRYLLFTGHDVPTHLYRNGGGVPSPRMELLKYSWDRTFRHEHSHDEEVSSVGISAEGELDGKLLNDWISKLLQTKGGDIYRMKGVLVVKGTKKRLVFQGVHMFFDAKFDREWQDGENRTNLLVFIGKNLDRAALTEGFKACLVA